MDIRALAFRGFLGLTLGAEMILLGLANFNRRRLAELAVKQTRPEHFDLLISFSAM